MSNESESSKVPDPFETMTSLWETNLKNWKEIRDTSLDSWSKMMIDSVNTDEYSRTTGQWLDTYLTLSQPYRRIIDVMMTQVLTNLNMPMRSDVTSLAERLTNIETRLDDQDAKLDDILKAIDMRSLAERLTNIETRLDDQDAKLDDIPKAIKAISIPKATTPKAATNSSAKAKVATINSAKAKEAH
jgi:predicted nucleic acid-binding protein